MKPFETIKVNVSLYLSKPTNDCKLIDNIRESIGEKVKDKLSDYFVDNNFSMAEFTVWLETQE